MGNKNQASTKTCIFYPTMLRAPKKRTWSHHARVIINSSLQIFMEKGKISTTTKIVTHAGQQKETFLQYKHTV
jgi:hypothetical protein